MKAFTCEDCGEGFYSGRALGGHRGLHSSAKRRGPSPARLRPAPLPQVEGNGGPGAHVLLHVLHAATRSSTALAARYCHWNTKQQIHPKQWAQGGGGHPIP